MALAIILLALPLPALAEETHKVTLAGPKSPGVQKREISLWRLGKVPSSEDLARLRGLSKEELDQALRSEFGASAPETYQAKREEGFALSLDLARAYYVAFDELVTEAGPMTGVMAFMVPDHTEKPLEAKPVPPDEEGSTRLIKVDEGGRPLKGVGFQVFFAPGHPLNPGSEAHPVPLNTQGASQAAYAPESSHSPVLYTDEKGHIRVTGLPPGDYIFREVKPLEGYGLEDPDNPFTIRAGQETEIRVVNSKGGGGRRFRKVSSEDGRGLAGAAFLVYQKDQDGKDVRVQVDGQDLILRTGPDGYFSAQGLAPGVYYLLEARAPDGFEGLREPIKFVIDEGSQETVLLVKNKPGGPSPRRPTGSREIPKTGDISLLIASGVGALLIGMGAYLIHDEKRGRAKA